jgi:hypothetical protein
MGALEDRNNRLDQLLAATNSWSTKRVKELEDRVTITKNILKGRTGSERLATASVAAAQDIVVNEIDDFLLA